MEEKNRRHKFNFEYLLIGIILGVIIREAFYIVDRDDCEKDLPRNEYCTLKWVKPDNATDQLNIKGQ